MDPIKNVSRWHRWTVTASESEITKVFSVLDANLPTGWRRLSGNELRLYEPLATQGSGWYALDPAPSYAGVTLSIERVGECQLRGDGVWFDRSPYPASLPGISAAWDQVTRFLDNGIAPAARTAGAQIRIPTAEDVFLSDLPADVRNRLRTFSESSRKSLPLNREEAERWRGFVIAAFRAKAVVDAQPFTDWLAASGWSKESAEELNLRFFDHCLLLSRYTDEVSAA